MSVCSVPRFVRLGLGPALLAFGLMSGAAQAQNTMVPTLVVDADTGEVIEANNATRPWHPASTTKLMTAYVALRAVKTGAITLDTPIVVSPLASRQRPSKIGVKPGQEVTLDNALKFLMVKSANDIAVVVAEGVAGSVENFAAMMNREARRMGMRESNWVNPHGWEDDRQYSSARDLAVLARALLTEFPEHSDLWGIGALKLGKRIYNNTNGLMGRYSGAMGMKTGFICASGFNLVGAAQRNGRTLIAVVLGASNGADRTLKAAQLLDAGFNSGRGWGATNGRTLDTLTASFETTAPNRRQEICRRGAAPASETEDTGSAIVQAHVDNPSALVMTQRAPSESMAVGSRSGNSIQLGPRATFEPIPVYLGRAPGSTAVARRPGVPAGRPQAAAFAPQQPRASGAPLQLPGAITAPARLNAGTQSPGAQAAISPANPRPATVAPAAERKKLAPRPNPNPNPKAKSKANPNPKADARNQTPKATAQAPARQRPANVSRQP
ncbi:MAG: serine hydrolase [Methylobacterium sp.]|jgi:D-alanyl-D-alanine carboxypeptidase|nr:serine hydrolase [Methylobacterium sp.]